MEEVKVEADLYGKVEMRVGTVVEVEIHPNADSMYVEKIDLGETNEDGENVPRTIVSGLRNHISLDDFKGKQVVIVCNLKPRKLRGLQSSGMVLCASNEDHSKVELITPSTPVADGSQLVVEGIDCSEPLNRLNPKKKIWEQVVEHLTTNDACEAVYKTYPLQVIDRDDSIDGDENQARVNLVCESLSNSMLG
jgi:methionine--tRNA ligase beta chain